LDDVTYNDTGLFLGKSLSFQKPRLFRFDAQLKQEAQQALVAADGPAELPEPSVEAVPGEVKEDTEKPEGPELTVDP